MKNLQEVHDIDHLEVLEALVEMEEILSTVGGAGLPNHRLGICHNLKATLSKKVCAEAETSTFLGMHSEVYYWVEAVSQSWPKYSGEPKWPVPDGLDIFSPEGEKWKGEPLTLRLSLIQHLKRECEIKVVLLSMCSDVMLQALNTLKSQALSGDLHCKGTGICYNLDELLRQPINGYEVYRFVDACSKTWPLTTGEEGYPVPHVYGVRYWEGENLKLRLSLIDHIIEVVKANMPCQD